jgi:hypothetical protein
MKESNKKVTLSVDSAIYSSFQDYCEENAIWISKKIEIWMRKEVEGTTLKLNFKQKKSKSKKRKITLSINSSVYDSFRIYCEKNAFLVSKKVENWMRSELQNNG